jgi:putative alpha-1,2-mannosidase
LPLYTCNKQVHKDEKFYVKYVDRFIGTSGYGNTYPGATVPFGMLQVSPDNGIFVMGENPNKSWGIQ